MKNLPLVSIITPVFNSEKFLSEAIESILAQDYHIWELIIIDDCSLDNSFGISKKYSNQDTRIKIFQTPQNSGVSVARNRGLAESSGKYIAFLDSDDIWLPSKLSVQVRFAESENIDFCFSSYLKISEAGIERGIVAAPEKVSYFDLLKSNYIGCLTVMIKKELISDECFTTVRLSEDYLLWLRLLRKTEFAYGITSALAKYRISEKSRSSNKIDAITFQWAIYRKIEKLGLIKSIYYFFSYMVIGYRRYRI